MSWFESVHAGQAPRVRGAAVAAPVHARRSRLPEPRMLIRGVVRDQVEDDPHAASPRTSDQLVELVEGAEHRLDVAVVSDVVAPITVGRGIHRARPEAVDAEPLEVVELVDHASEIADAVAVRVGERAEVDLMMEDRALPPGAHPPTLPCPPWIGRC
jgi:hypothetical protein